MNLPHKLCAEIAGGSGHGQGGVTLHLKKGENTLDGEQALAYSRIREPSECPGKGKSAYTFGYSDLDRANAQQAVINGIKDRLTSFTRIPYNFIKGPIIGWDAPKAFVSDMGFFTMPQLVLAAGDRRDRRHQRPLRHDARRKRRSAAKGRKARSKCPSRSAARRSTG